MARKLPVHFAPRAWAIFMALPPAQQQQARRLIAAIQLADGMVGRPWSYDNRGRRLWIVSASDTHVIHRIVFAQEEPEVGETFIRIALILVYDTPPDPNDR